MYIRWDTRPRKHDLVYRAVLVHGVREQGRLRIQRLGYLGSIRARWCHAPAHRQAFWAQVTPRLERLVPDAAQRQRVQQQLAQRIAPPTPGEQQALAAQRAWLAAWTPAHPVVPPERAPGCPGGTLPKEIPDAPHTADDAPPPCH